MPRSRPPSALLVRLSRTTTRLAGLAGLALLAASVAACGSNGGSGPEPGTLVLEAAMSCSSGPVTITVDGGTPVAAQLIPGQAMRSFALTPGRHMVAAQRTNGSMRWGPMEVIVQSKATLTVVMQC